MSQTFANREVCNLTFCDYQTKAPFLNVDYANTTTTELTGESVYAYGGQGHPKRVVFNGEKGGTIAFETQLQSMKLYSLMTGAAIEGSARFIRREEVVAGAEGALAVTGTPVSGSVNVYAADDDCGTALDATVSSQTVTVEDATQGSTYIVYYLEEPATGVQKINIKSTTFPKAFTVYGETFNKTEDDEIVPYRLVAYKCVPQNNISLSFANSGDPATLTVTCDLLPDEDDNLLDLILIDDE